jgi:protein-tyrosine phosphatase
LNTWQRIKERLFPAPKESATETAFAEAGFWRVDMHSHLLPGVDDGVSSYEQTLDCLQQLVGMGIQKVITTPHVSRDWFPNGSDTLRAGQAELKALVEEHQLPLQIEVAAEYLIDDFFPDLLTSNDVLTFGAERYLLFETGWAAAPRYLHTLIFQMQTQGYTPVLAHPERYKYYHEDEAALRQLREIGCLFQLNWLSVTGRYGSKVHKQAKRLLQQQWVDFVGSDLHRPEDLTKATVFFQTAEYKLLRNQPLRNASLL